MDLLAIAEPVLNAVTVKKASCGHLCTVLAIGGVA